MRIGYVTGHYVPFAGGVESHVEQIAKRLAARGDEVTVLTQSDDPTWPARESLDGVDVRRFPVPLPSRHFAVSPQLLAALRSRREALNVVHTHGYHSIVPLLTAVAGARPIVFTPHYHGTGHSPLRKALHAPYRFAAGRRVLRSAARVICVSEPERRLLLRHFPDAAAKTSVVPNGVDLGDLQAAEPFAKERRTIVSAGRLESYKHVDDTLRALARLDHTHELVVTGDGSERMRLQALARELGLDGRARFLGRIPTAELYRWYRTADVYVSMSSNEAMPVAILELLACGARVVASDIPAHRELRRLTRGPIWIVPLAPAPDLLAEAIGEAASASPPADVSVPTWDEVADATRSIYAEVRPGA